MNDDDVSKVNDYDLKLELRAGFRLLTELREYADMIHCNCAGSRFISFSIVGRAIDTAVKFAIWKRQLATWEKSLIKATSHIDNHRRGHNKHDDA